MRPAKLWNDTESAPDAALAGRAPARRAGGVGRRVRQRAGGVRSPSPSCRGCTGHEPEPWQRRRTVLLPHDWLTPPAHRRRLVTDRGDASGTGYWSPATAVPAGPPRARRPRAGLVGVVPTVPARPRPPATGEAPWSAPGTGDNMAAALGVGLRPGDVVVSIGTSGTVYGVSDAPTADPTRRVAGFADATGRFLPLVCTLNATKVTEAVRRLLGVDHDELDRLALAGRRRGRRAHARSPTSTASARPTGPTPRACSPGSAATSTRAARPGRGRGRGVRPARRPRRARLVRRRPAGGWSWSAAAARSRRLPTGSRRPHRAAGDGAPRRRAGVRRCVRAGSRHPGRHRPDRCGGRLGPRAPGDLVEPGPGAVAAADVRASYGALRNATAG